MATYILSFLPTFSMVPLRFPFAGVEYVSRARQFYWMDFAAEANEGDPNVNWLQVRRNGSQQQAKRGGYVFCSWSADILQVIFLTQKLITNYR